MSSADMDLTAVDSSMRSLRDNADQYLLAWERARAKLDGFLPALGAGVLGQAFTPKYREVDTSIREAAEVVPRRYRRFAQAGADSVIQYREADLRSARMFPGG
ncbi:MULTISPECIES: hypothetical protein [unclassified Crossiella]|uniref:hypothetical protein n=1 Tax=unclassified Crossiella TaxID=2620835 RepID=UPI001FFEADA7|nr:MULTISPECIES: hypothetical protein [unclassified Crossiella]MCK2242241.1 hypothetical protein [Crossiella sp. S99.2]MCK2254728.1 hypothetical protein [Crossiella sp. S99.1]